MVLRKQYLKQTQTDEYDDDALWRHPNHKHYDAQLWSTNDAFFVIFLTLTPPFSFMHLIVGCGVVKQT